MERTDILRFTRPPAQQSNAVKIDQIVGTNGVSSYPLHGRSRDTHHDTGIIESRSRQQQPPSTLHRVIERKSKEGSVTVAPDAIIPRPLPLSILPLSDIVWSYFGLCYKGVAPINPYKRNQDAFVVEHDSVTDTLLLAVLDGHGEHGDRCAMWASRELPLRCFVHPLWADDPAQAMKDVGAELARALGSSLGDDEDEGQAYDRKPEEELFLDTEFSGTTLTAVAVRAAVIYVFHLGDCRVVLGSKTPPTPPPPPPPPPQSSNTRAAAGAKESSTLTARSKSSGQLFATALTVDHRPGVKKERRRIVDAGGRVFGVHYDDGSTGVPRLWLPNLDVPGLAVSRSLGDSVGSAFAGLSSEPDLCQVPIDPPGVFEEKSMTAAQRKKKRQEEQRRQEEQQRRQEEYQQQEEEEHQQQTTRKPSLSGLRSSNAGRGDGLLILATDGVWAVLSSQEAVDACVECADKLFEKQAQDALADRWYGDDEELNSALGAAAQASTGGQALGLKQQWRGQQYVELGGGKKGLAGCMAEALVNAAQDRWMTVGGRQSGSALAKRSDDTTVVVALLCDFKRR